MRVRGMAQNDAHIYCTQEQAVDEFVNVMKLHEYYYRILGINEYHLELALRDPKNKTKYHGDTEMWKLAEKLMRQAVAKVNIKMVEEEGSAAFYGPKIDFIVHSSVGREFAVSTNQIDLYMGKRFNLKYTDEKGKEQTPVIIHRAPLGSHERFIGFLIEHFGGAVPTLLAPGQAEIIPVSEKTIEYAKKVAEKLTEDGIRNHIDESGETVGKKIREAEKQKIPYMLVVGPKEAESNSVAVRARGEVEIGPMPLSKFVESANKEISTKSLKPLVKA